ILHARLTGHCNRQATPRQPCFQRQSLAVRKMGRTPPELCLSLGQANREGVLGKARKGESDRVLLEVAYAEGLRVSELVALSWADVLHGDEGRVQLSISGKGGAGQISNGPRTRSARRESFRNDPQWSLESSAMDTLFRLDHHARGAI